MPSTKPWPHFVGKHISHEGPYAQGSLFQRLGPKDAYLMWFCSEVSHVVWLTNCPPKVMFRTGTDRHFWMGIDHLRRVPGGTEEGVMMGCPLSWAGRAFLADLTARAKAWGAVLSPAVPGTEQVPCGHVGFLVVANNSKRKTA